LDVSWTFLNTRIETLMKASQDGFDLDAEITKVKEAIDKLSNVKAFLHLKIPQVMEMDSFLVRLMFMPLLLKLILLLPLVMFTWIMLISFLFDQLFGSLLFFGKVVFFGYPYLVGGFNDKRILLFFPKV